eukprot:Phypoly_transcript_19976.p1 GENE.Phypoly_transcript_19976~~Phypoly_transcript_19976.p1  ORF type:complete len:101 (-),score=5.77 Phypoly_transcript_19976:398-661(-)
MKAHHHMERVKYMVIYTDEMKKYQLLLRYATGFNYKLLYHCNSKHTGDQWNLGELVQFGITKRAHETCSLWFLLWIFTLDFCSGFLL